MDPQWREAQRIGKYRTALGVPILREGVPIGVLAMTRSSVRPFSDKQIELATTFADQAVIAIENVRLFDEVQAQKRELSEALEHQTATAEVLNVISRSPTNAQPVFDAIVESAARLCEAIFSVVWLYDGDRLHHVASSNFTPDVLKRILKTYPKRPDRSTVGGRAVLDRNIQEMGLQPDDPSSVPVADLGFEVVVSRRRRLDGCWTSVCAKTCSRFTRTSQLASCQNTPPPTRTGAFIASAQAAAHSDRLGAYRISCLPLAAAARVNHYCFCRLMPADHCIAC